MAYRYYHTCLSSLPGRSLFVAPLDKAFVIACLQDLLSPRAHISSSPSPLDLVAYHLTDSAINLLVYAKQAHDVDDFTWQLLDRLMAYLQAQKRASALPFNSPFRHELLSNEYDVLEASRQIHRGGENWRSNRYSSIGFYLDDRRGDWLQAWRLAELYGNAAQWYEAFLEEQEEVSAFEAFEFIET